MDNLDLQVQKETVVQLALLDHKVRKVLKAHRETKGHQELQAQTVNQVLKEQRDLPALKAHKVVLGHLV